MKHKRIAILLVISFLLSLFTVAVLTINIFAQEETWIEVVSERTRNGKKFQGQINPNRFALDLSIGSIHYDGPDWKDINNTLVPSIADVPQLGLVDWEMTQDDYEWFALETLNTVPMWLFRNRTNSDSYITFNPQALQWTNDLDQISQVSTIVSDTVGQVSDNSIHWENAYGIGRNLTLFTNPNRMVKHLTLESYPGNPPAFITNGENASLELRFIFDTPSGPNQPDIFVNGILWDRRDRVQTADEVEFRVGGETLFVFTHPIFSDSDASSGVGMMVFTRQGGNVIVGVRVPLTFLQNAIYPVTIDPTVDEQVGAGTDDVHVNEDSGGPGSWVLNTASINQAVGYINTNAEKNGGGQRFQTVAIPNAASISTAYLNYTARITRSQTTVNTVIIGEAVDDAATFSDLTNYQNRRGTVVGGPDDNNITSASVNWDGIGAWTADVNYLSPEIKTIIQEIVDRSGWATGQDMVIFWDDHAARGTESNNVYRIANSYDADSSKAPRLHIEYGAAATCQALTVIVNNPQGQMYFNGTTDDPTGGLWQEENVSEDYQTAVTPAINVTNDDGSGACDVTLELLTSPGSGRTMKWSLTSTAPNPGVNSIPIGSNTTAVSSLGSGSTQAIYLWVDYEDSQGGSVSPTLRVDTELP